MVWALYRPSSHMHSTTSMGLGKTQLRVREYNAFWYHSDLLSTMWCVQYGPVFQWHPVRIHSTSVIPPFPPSLSSFIQIKLWGRVHGIRVSIHIISVVPNENRSTQFRPATIITRQGHLIRVMCASSLLICYITWPEWDKRLIFICFFV
jgi:hypothetical protein